MEIRLVNYILLILLHMTARSRRSNGEKRKFAEVLKDRRVLSGVP